MKLNNLPYLLIILCTIPFISACDDDEAEPEITKTDMLTSQTWQGEAVFASGVDVTNNPDLIASMLDVTTLTIDFEADGTYTANYEEDDVPVTTEGEWEFRSNETVLYLDLLQDYDLKIDELTTEKLVLTTTVQAQGFEVPAEVHFVAQ